ncbi:YciI family protein [Devosia sp. A16]|uniref:YciI family protein n=1 Tax=Devosia sp. A16 TaxID=1736675 RepID=UPI0006D772BA|nr:YciI family protein [Devosia sp. A16]
MRYVCLVHVDQSLIDSATPEQLAAMDGDNQRANAELTASGHLILDLALKEPTTARIVRSRAGQVSATDGPYVESKEHLGGFFVIEARDMQEAEAIARREPMARFGAIEVRAELGLSWQQPQQG